MSDIAPELRNQLSERFATLPKVVQHAITSADVQAHLRDLAKNEKLHVDQWQVLENDVMLTLLGFQRVADLTMHLKKDLELTDEVATSLAQSISETIFAPIRGEMEQALDNPSAVPTPLSDIETAREQEMHVATSEGAQAPMQPPALTVATAVQPATPPAPGPDEKAIRAQISGSYSGAASHERKSIEGDPYREQLS